MENFEVYEDDSGEWRWRVKGDNGQIVAASEGYTRKADAERGLRDMKSIVEFNPLPFKKVEGQSVVSRATDGGLPRAMMTRVEELIAAAHCYLSAAHRGNAYDLRQVPMDWPWRREDWKPGTKLENMEK